MARETRSANRFASTSTVTVTLNDVNDNAPVFSDPPYTATVRENSDVGTLIETITVRL